MFFLDRNRNNLSDIFNDNFLEDIFGTTKTVRSRLNSDLVENEKEYLLKVEIPGFNKEDIKISYEDNVLNISAERNESIDKSDEAKNYVHKEIHYGSCSRSYRLDNINSDEIRASYENGILNLTLPKKEIDTSKKYISIE